MRAVVLSHAPGLRGTPSRGQRSSARVKASCAHSLGEIPVAGPANQARDDPTPLVAERFVDRRLGSSQLGQMGLISTDPN